MTQDDKKGSEREHKQNLSLKTDNGVLIEMSGIEVYGVKLGNIKIDMRDEKTQTHEVVNKEVEKETLRLLQEVCQDAEIVEDGPIPKKEQKKRGKKE